MRDIEMLKLRLYIIVYNIRYTLVKNLLQHTEKTKNTEIALQPKYDKGGRRVCRNVTMFEN